ncbi:MAG: ECF transporter S component [Acutalibacter muris]|nr:ECF transporter S component [Acutalibacter muris]
MEKQTKIYKISAVGIFAALVFVSNYLSVPVPVAIGDVSRIHFGNIFCLLSGFVLGPIGGGLAAGIGSGLYDLTNPAYIASAPFTFLFKFLLAAVCGWAANVHGARAENHVQNVFAAAAGSLTYMILYLGKAFVQGLLLGSEMGAVLTALATKAVTSGINAVIAVVVSVPLCAVVRLALRRSHMLEKMG